MVIESGNKNIYILLMNAAVAVCVCVHQVLVDSYFFTHLCPYAFVTKYDGKFLTFII